MRAFPQFVTVSKDGKELNAVKFNIKVGWVTRMEWIILLMNFWLGKHGTFKNSSLLHLHFTLSL